MLSGSRIQWIISLYGDGMGDLGPGFIPPNHSFHVSPPNTSLCITEWPRDQIGVMMRGFDPLFLISFLTGR